MPHKNLSNLDQPFDYHLVYGFNGEDKNFDKTLDLKELIYTCYILNIKKCMCQLLLKFQLINWKNILFNVFVFQNVI